MYSQLTPKGVRIPNGFAVSAYAYHYFLDKVGLTRKVREILQDLDIGNIAELQKRGRLIRQLIEEKEFPSELSEAIADAYSSLEKEYYQNVDVAVRRYILMT